jgi:hypothetical protein
MILIHYWGIIVIVTIFEGFLKMAWGMLFFLKKSRREALVFFTSFFTSLSPFPPVEK